MVRASRSRSDARASSSPRGSSSRIRAHHVDNEDDQQSSQPHPLRLPDAQPRHHHQYQQQTVLDQETQQYRQAVQHQQQLTRARSRSSPSIILDAPTRSRPLHHHQTVHLHHGSSASVNWLQQQRERNAREASPSVHVQPHYPYQDDQEDARRNTQDHRLQQVALGRQRLTTYAYQAAPPPSQQQADHQPSSYEMDAFDHHQDASRRSFTGKRKASDPESDLAAEHDYTPAPNVYTYDSVHLPATLTLSSGVASRGLEHHGRLAEAAMQTRRSFPPYTHSQYIQQQHRQPGDYHAATSSSDNHEQRWLRRQEEDETKVNYPQQRERSETSLSSLARPTHASSSPPIAQRAPGRRQPQPAAEPALPFQARVITNASRNITFAMLQPHFERPMQETALRFGVCMTLFKKICRNNGITSWPFRRICGLHKSIASMEKQVHYFDGEQKRSYADQLYKLELELEAFKRTANALTPEFEATVEAEGGLGEAGLGLGQQEQDDRHAETKTEDVEIAFSYSYEGEDNNGDGLGSPPPLSAVATRVSVSSFTYASPTNQDIEEQEQDAEDHLTQQQQQQQQYTSVRHVMAATLDLGYDDTDDGRQRGRYARDSPEQQQQAQSLVHHHYHAASPHSSRAARTPSSNRYLVPPQGPPMQRALPSLSFMLRRQSLSLPNQHERADGSLDTNASAANPRFYQPS